MKKNVPFIRSYADKNKCRVADWRSAHPYFGEPKRWMLDLLVGGLKWLFPEDPGQLAFARN